MNEPTSGWLPHPSVQDMQEGLRRWADACPRQLRVAELGRSAGDRPILAATITDEDVPDGPKQRVLFTACHAGAERNACTGLLHFVKWLIGDDPQAAVYRRSYVVAVVPCADPDGYEAVPPRSSDPNCYVDWSWDGPGATPEARALFGLMETLQPEAHVDVHGQPYRHATMWESTGISWVSPLSRCHEPELTRFIDDAAERQGFLITRGEADAGRVLSSAPVPDTANHYYLNTCSKNITCVSYHRYHSLGFIIEAGFEDSLVERARALLAAGLRRWRYQRTPALPCDHVGIWCSTQLAAWGDSPAQRRASRVELWRRSSEIGLGAAHPERRGVMASLATFTAAGAALLGTPQPQGWHATWRTQSWPDILDRLRHHGQFDIDGLTQWFRQRPAPPDGESLQDACAFCGPNVLKADASPPTQGAVIRMLIPDADADVRDIALDGRRMGNSTTEGYTLTRGPGCVVHVAIPPGQVRGLHIATCAYDCKRDRRDGFGPHDWVISQPRDLVDRSFAR